MKMAHLFLQVLQLLIMLFVTECRDSSPVTVSASQEEDALLPCFNSSLMDPKSCYRVKWTKQDSGQMKVILAWPTTSKSQDVNRVKWEAGGNGQMSLLLTKLQKSDEGLYSCEVWKGWECVLVKNISLKVKDCKTLKAVKAESSATASLSCSDITPRQQRPLNISWKMLKGGIPVNLSLDRVEINETSLAIQSVSLDDSGWYRCTYMFGQIQRCFDINLQVQKEHVTMATTTVPVAAEMTVQGKSMKKESSGTFIAVVASVITVVAVTAALIGLFVYHRFSTQRFTQQTQRHRADAPIQCDDVYETVNDTHSDDYSITRVNNMYQQIQDESLFTFNFQ